MRETLVELKLASKYYKTDTHWNVLGAEQTFYILMNKISDYKNINFIKTIGFRKFKDEFKTKLYDTTLISGGNTQGKTNILYAIVWGFFRY